MIYRIKNSFILFNDNPTYYIKDYYNYIVTLLMKVLNESDMNITIDVDDRDINIYEYPELLSNKIIKIRINYEHTIVKKGGRDADSAPIGNIKTLEGDNYLVRIDNYNNNMKSDIIIDYSIPNIINITKSNLFEEYAKKLTYIAPFLYTRQWDIKPRTIQCLTTFINTNEPRRHKLLNELQKTNLQHINVNNCFDKQALETLYCNTKIIINIHQTDHHHTFEELRVLPALLCGVITICEESPIKEYIPYNKYIIWSTYDEILNKTIEVLSNYDFYYNQIFGNDNPDAKNIFLQQEEFNYIHLKKRIEDS